MKNYCMLMIVLFSGGAWAGEGAGYRCTEVLKTDESRQVVITEADVFVNEAERENVHSIQIKGVLAGKLGLSISYLDGLDFELAHQDSGCGGPLCNIAKKADGVWTFDAAEKSRHPGERYRRVEGKFDTRDLTLTLDERYNHKGEEITDIWYKSRYRVKLQCKPSVSEW